MTLYTKEMVAWLLLLLFALASATPASVPCARFVCTRDTPEYRATVMRWVANVRPNGPPDRFIASLLLCGTSGEPLSLFEVASIISPDTPTVFNVSADIRVPGTNMHIDDEPTAQELINTLDLVFAYVKYQEIRHAIQDEQLARIHNNETRLNATINATGP